MSYIGAPFDHDLFVSYSHGSDGEGEAFLQGWSEAFAKALERELRANRKVRDLRVFLDKGHRQGHSVDPLLPLNEQLKREIEGSGLLVVLMSLDYLGSAWCKDERDWWQAHQTKRGMSCNGRVAVVRILPTEERWPDFLLDSAGNELPGFKFFVGEGDSARPLGWTDKSPEMPEGYFFGKAFSDALLDVAAGLYPWLDSLKAQVDSLRRRSEEQAKLAEVGGQSIYLHGRSDRRAHWETAFMHLADNGFVVVPGEPDPVGADPQESQRISQHRVETMSACDALLLLGTDDGRALDADLVVVGRLDRQSARARSRRLLPCGVLDTAGAALATPMRRATARNAQADWLDGTQEPWAPGVQQWLAQKAMQAGPAP